MRFRIPLIGYISACLVGTGVVTLLALLDNLVREDAPGPAPIEVWLLDLPVMIAWAVVISLPIGLPAILATERRAKGPLWVFMSVALLHVAFIIGWFSPLRSNVDLGIFVILATPFCLGWLSYWYIAWKRFPPEEKVSLAAGEQE